MSFNILFRLLKHPGPHPAHYLKCSTEPNTMQWSYKSRQTSHFFLQFTDLLIFLFLNEHILLWSPGIVGFVFLGGVAYNKNIGVSTVA